MAAIPDWKQALLRKKQQLKESERQRQIEELKRLESIPAWKRQILEKRKSQLAEGNTFRVTPDENIRSTDSSASDQSEKNRNSRTAAAQNSHDAATTKNDFLRSSRPSCDDGVSEEHCRSVQNNPFLVSERRGGSDVTTKIKRRSFSPTNTVVVVPDSKKSSSDDESQDRPAKSSSKAKTREVIIIPKDDLENLIILDPKSEKTKQQPPPHKTPVENSVVVELKTGNDVSHSDAANNKIGKLLDRFGRAASFEDFRETFIRVRASSVEKKPDQTTTKPRDDNNSKAVLQENDQNKVAHQPPVKVGSVQPSRSVNNIQSSAQKTGRPSQSRPPLAVNAAARTNNGSSQPPSVDASMPTLTGPSNLVGEKKPSSHKVVVKSTEEVDSSSPSMVAPPRRKKRSKLPASLLIRLESDGPIDPSLLDPPSSTATTTTTTTTTKEEIPVTSIDEPPPPKESQIIEAPASSLASLPNSKSDSELLTNGLSKLRIAKPDESSHSATVSSAPLSSDQMGNEINKAKPTPARRAVQNLKKESTTFRVVPSHDPARKPVRGRPGTKHKPAVTPIDNGDAAADDASSKENNKAVVVNGGGNLEGLSKARQAVAKLKQDSTTLHFVPNGPSKSSSAAVPITNIDDVQPLVNGTASHDEDGNGSGAATNRTAGKVKKAGGLPLVVGANESISKPSVLKKPGNKSRKKMSLSFDDKATVTYEYPSETSLLEQNGEEAAATESTPTPDQELVGGPLKTNTPLGHTHKGGLHNYTPNYLQKAVFGSAAAEPAHQPEPPKPEPEPEVTAAKPLEDSEASYFSSSSTSALLF